MILSLKHLVSALSIFRISLAAAATQTCTSDSCLKAIAGESLLGIEFCLLWEVIPETKILPAFVAPCSANASKLSSACACALTAPGTNPTSVSKSIFSTTASTTSSSTRSPSSSASSTHSSTSSCSVVTVISSITVTQSSTATLISTYSVAPVTSYVTVTATSISYISVTASNSACSSQSSSGGSLPSTSTILSSSTTSISTAQSSSTTSSATPCTCTAYSQIAPAVAACTEITLQDIYAPSNSSIDLTAVKKGSTVTFAGTTTFGFTNSSTFNPIQLGGSGVTITAAPGAIIDGNGQAYWDGQGSNGGVPKPDHFIVVNKMTANSVIKNLYIQNYPVHCFSISSCSNLTISNIYLNNTAGNAPNAISGGLPAGHNSDGFDISTTSSMLLTSSIVYNQDDCVAVTSGNGITVSNMYCSGGHGLSIGSVGGKSNNNVTNILFTDSVVALSQNGARVKSNYNTTGFISNITYSNIELVDISIYGIDVQQDYLNGGPTGIPSNGVIIEGLTFQNVTGSALANATDYHILCGSGSCSDFDFEDVNIVGGGVARTCNYPPTGCPAS